MSEIRPIGIDMARNLLKGIAPSSAVSSSNDSTRWPGKNGMITLANAVKAEQEYVIIRSIRFSIKYNDDNILLKPSTGEAFPMGYFSYKELKSVLEVEASGH